MTVVTDNVDKMMDYFFSGFDFAVNEFSTVL